MTLTELRYLVAVAETLHFGRAAERFGVSQPTLSMAIRNLEQTLGLMLFERNKSGMRATREGEAIVAQARKVVAQADLIAQLAQADADQLGGEFGLGAIDSLGPYLLPQLIPQLRLLAPGLRLRLCEGDADSLGQKLRQSELDGILIALPFSQPDIVTQELYREPLVAVMPPNHALAAKSQISQSDLAGQTFIQLSQDQRLRDQIFDYCPALGANESGMDASSLETLRHMVAIGLGISMLPLSATTSPVYSPQAITARPLVSNPCRTLGLAWRASFPRHKAIDALRRAIQICAWQFTTTQDTAGSGLLVENNSW